MREEEEEKEGDCEQVKRVYVVENFDDDDVDGGQANERGVGGMFWMVSRDFFSNTNSRVVIVITHTPLPTITYTLQPLNYPANP